MKIGTKSLLFGCHQFIWHPLTLAFAYRKLFREWPDLVGWLCIIFHDVGYWGCADIDGKEGKLHPLRGANIVGKLVYHFHRLAGHKELHALAEGGFAAHRCLLHSRSIAHDNGLAPSDICWADKYVVCVEPEWFYLFRTWLSGESKEFVQNAINTGHLPAGTTNLEWHRWYRHKVLTCPEIHDLLQDESPVRNHLLRNSPRALKKWKKAFEKTAREPAARINTQHTS